MIWQMRAPHSTVGSMAGDRYPKIDDAQPKRLASLPEMVARAANPEK
jgi:hypothetical protein